MRASLIGAGCGGLRVGDGIDESSTAQMIVSETDIAPEIPGNRNLWVQGVGCGSAVALFSN
jgi:hypothetical protein